MELYRKHRPRSLKTMIGNRSVTKSFQGYIEKGSLPHCLLFTGPTGCGKTTMARILKNELNADPDFGYRELDSTVFRGIDTARELQESIRNKPMKGDVKVIVLDEAHQFGVGGSSEKNLAQNGLLKALENCPDYVYFILCTTNPEMLIPTVKGRCTNFQMEPLEEEDIKKLLVRVGKKEKVKPPKEAIEQIIDSAEGLPRNALQMLGKILHLDNEEDMARIIEEEAKKASSTKELCYALLDGKDWKDISQILQGLRAEQPETIRRAILGMMQSALVNGWGLYKDVDPWEIMAWFYEKATYDSGMAGIVFCCRAITEGKEAPY